VERHSLILGLIVKVKKENLPTTTVSMGEVPAVFPALIVG